MRKISILLLHTFLMLTIHAARAAGADAGEQPDWNGIAKHMVRNSLHLAPNERVILHYLPDHNPALVAALRDQIVLAGGIISAELTWPSLTMGKYFDGLSTANKLKPKEHAKLWRMYERAIEIDPVQINANSCPWRQRTIRRIA